MEWVYIFGMMKKLVVIKISEIDMSENGKKEWKMDMGNSFIVMEVFMKDFGKMIKKKVLGFWVSRIEQKLVDCFKMIYF